MIYRTVMPPLNDQQKEELTPLEQDLRKRNICIKRLFNIPMADMEIIFPDRKLHLQPITIVQLVVNLIAGVVAAYMMVAKVCRCVSMCARAINPTMTTTDGNHDEPAY